MSYSDDFHPRSQSADTRRMRFAQRRMFSEDYVNDTFYAPQGAPLSHSSPENVVYSGSIADPGGVTRRRFAEVNQDGTTLPRSVKTVHFPSTYREQVSEQHTPTQFNSAAHNFTQHLRERSPSSSSALLNLLSRYPSAKQSVYSSTSSSAGVSSPNNDSARRIYRLEERPIGTQSFRPTDALLSYSLVEHSVPKFQQQQQQPHYSDSSPHRTQLSLQKESPSQLSSESPLSFPLYNSNFRQSPTLPHSNISDINRNDTQQNVNGFSTLHSTANNSATKAFDNRSEHKFYTDLPNNSHHTLTARNKQWEELLDVTQLDSLLASVLEENMNRSTTEWSNSFAQVQNRFKNMPPETSDSGLLHGFTSSGAPTLPRCSGSFTLPKSSSHNDINQSDSSVRVTGRRTVEAPEVRKSGAIDSFWSQTVNSRPLSPTVQRIPGNLTAAERLQMLQESHSKSNIVNKPGSGIQLAARREHYLHEASSTSSYIPPHRETTKRTGAPHVAYRGPSPNFSDLDNAVNELQCGVRNTGYSSSAGRLGGCARFPTDDRALSPPRGNTAMISRRVNSPSPTDSNTFVKILAGYVGNSLNLLMGKHQTFRRLRLLQDLESKWLPFFDNIEHHCNFNEFDLTCVNRDVNAYSTAIDRWLAKRSFYVQKLLKHTDFSPQKLDHYETSATKSPIQAGSLHTPEQPEKLSPKFYFPQGVPVSMMENDAVLRRVCLFFRELPNEQVIVFVS
uniref:SH2 domain-containing protein n=1 Tax=Angiostrongylus cantonensis TaxID=6313 RepID=A0A0K0DMQ6_ANGCA